MISIMNHFSHDMTFTVEHQCQYDDKFLPTLDFKIKLITKGTPKLLYRFYKKPVSSKLAILQTSAHPEGIRINTITQEVLRTLSNTSKEATKEKKI